MCHFVFCFKFARIGGQLVIGNLFGLLLKMAIPGPEDIGIDLLTLADLLAPLATAFGNFPKLYNDRYKT